MFMLIKKNNFSVSSYGKWYNKDKELRMLRIVMMSETFKLIAERGERMGINKFNQNNALKF